MNYGRNFEFRVAPERGARPGRFVNDTGSAIPFGTPVAIDHSTEDELGRKSISPVTGATDFEHGVHGILIAELIPAEGYAGVDPFLTTYSDIDSLADGQAGIVVSGDYVKVVLRNTEDRTFLNTRAYTGRMMVAGLGATPTVAAGDMLTPGTGDDDNGYWAETSTASEGWLLVTDVDTTRGEVEARLRF